MPRQQFDLASGVLFMNYDDVTGDYRIGVPSKLPFTIEVSIEDENGTVIGTFDEGNIITDSDNRKVQFRPKNQSKSGAKVPLIRVTSRWSG